MSMIAARIRRLVLSWTNYQRLAAVALLLVAALAAALLMYRQFDERQKFRADLFQKLDALHELLAALRPNNLMRTDTVSHFSIDAEGAPRGGEATMPLPLTFFICSQADAINQQFERVSLALVTAATDDPQGFASWAKDLQVEYRRRGQDIITEIARIKAQYQRDNNAFSTSLSIGVGETPDGDFYFSNGDFSGCRIEPLLQIDLQEWMASVIDSHSRNTVQ